MANPEVIPLNPKGFYQGDLEYMLVWYDRCESDMSLWLRL